MTRPTPVRTLSSLRRLWGIGVRTDATGLRLSLGLGLASGILVPLFPLLLAHLVDAATRGQVATVTVLAASVGVVFTGALVTHAYATMFGWNVWERATVVVDEELVALVTRLESVDELHDPEFQQRLTVVRTDRQQFQESVVSLFSALRLGLEVSLTVAILAWVAPLLLLLPLCAAAPVLTSGYAQRRSEAARRASVPDVRRADGLGELAMSVPSAAELRVLRLPPLVRQRHRASWDSMVSRQWRADIVGTAAAACGLAVFTAGFAAAVLYVTSLSLDGGASLGAVVLVLTAGQQLHGQVSAVLANAGAFLRVVATMRNLEWVERFVLDREQRGANPVVAAGDICFDEVRFHYPGGGEEALRGVTLTLPAGSVVAVVGDNGAGKSTLVAMLCGLHRPSGGRITVGGLDLSETDTRAWRGQVSAAFQEFVRFELLAREAVGVGLPAHVDDEPAVRAALARADVADLEAELPDGLATPLGRSFLDGVDLSGGQWQKVALARAMMHAAPAVLVLDEPTYALDVESERRVFEWFSTVARTHVDGAGPGRAGPTTVIVSHRFSTVRAADLVVVLDRGQVVETGHHQELMAAGGRYATMYRTQADGYR